MLMVSLARRSPIHHAVSHLSPSHPSEEKSTMASTFDDKIPFEKNGLQLFGLLKRGDPARALPLVVLIHGSGTTAAYFDNSSISVVKKINALGHDVLNISRPGYAGTPAPSTRSPMTESVPVFIDFVEEVYNNHASARHGNGGIILVGHSLGGAFAFSIAYEARDRLPLLGVSSLGCCPVKHSYEMLPTADPDPENPRFVVETNLVNLRRYMGELDWIRMDALRPEVMESVFEPIIKAEIVQWSTDEYYDYLVGRVFPGIKIPVQYLASELEVAWSNASEAQDIFNGLVSKFTTEDFRSAILPAGGHNYEFSINAPLLWDKRRSFIERLTTKNAASPVSNTFKRACHVGDHANSHVCSHANGHFNSVNGVNGHINSINDVNGLHGINGHVSGVNGVNGHVNGHVNGVKGVHSVKSVNSINGDTISHVNGHVNGVNGVNSVNGNSSYHANTEAFTSIPVLDYAEAASPSTRPQFLNALKDAIVNVGFFYLKNTNVPAQVQSDFTKQAIALFDLPLRKKLEIEMVNSKHFLGYARLGQEITALKKDFREQFDFATEMPAPGPEEPLYHNLKGPNQWPDPQALPKFRNTIETYMAYIDQLAESFKSLIAQALDLPPASFEQFFDHPQQNKLKLIQYPEPVGKPGQDTQGVGPHRDSCFLTFLLQGTPHTGLEVQNKAGTWLPVKPIPGTLVINIGRALEAITGGVCTATTHRVNLRRENYIDADGNSLGPRYSFAVFQGVSLDVGKDQINIQIPQHIKDLVKDEKVRTDAEATFNQMFSGNIGEGTLIARVTSHQDVAQRWYPELLSQALKAQNSYRL